jgi:hypothetical protein
VGITWLSEQLSASQGVRQLAQDHILHKNACQNHDIDCYKCCENLAKLRYLEMIVRNQNYIHEEVKFLENLAIILLIIICLGVS